MSGTFLRGNAKTALAKHAVEARFTYTFLPFTLYFGAAWSPRSVKIAIAVIQCRNNTLSATHPITPAATGCMQNGIDFFYKFLENKLNNEKMILSTNV